jgi:hypothetical protein
MSREVAEISDKTHEIEVRGRPVLTPDDYDGKLAELRDAVSKLSAEVDESLREEGHSFESYPKSPSETAAVSDQLERALLTSITVAERAAKVSEPERVREIARKALETLSSEELDRVGAAFGLTHDGTDEQLRSKIAGSVDDLDRLAQTIILNQTPTPERGIRERLFGLSGEVDPGRIAFLGQLKGHYVPAGTARWFLFRGVKTTRRGVQVDGEVLSYQAEAVSDVGEFRMEAIPRTKRVTVSANGSTTLSTRSSGVTEARLGALAVAGALGRFVLRRFPTTPVPSGASFSHWDPRSVVLVDLLEEWLPSEGFEVMNLKQAQFETGIGWSDPTQLRPSVSSVRFEGAHLLDSQPACALLSEGRALVAVTLVGRFKQSSARPSLVPLEFSIGRDYASVSTGYVEGDKRLTELTHSRAEAGLRGAVSDGPRSLARLAGVIEEIEERARQVGIVERATIFGPSRSTDADS